jgi:EpsI family protein
VTQTATALEKTHQQTTLRDLWRSRTLRLYAAVVGSAALILYSPAFYWLYTIWRDDKEYSHGFLVPFVVLYLCWVKREQLRSLPIRPNAFAGWIGLAVAAVALAFGRAGGYPLLAAMSFLLFIPATIALFFGLVHLRKLALPLAYCQFAVPWMDPFLEKLYLPFQLFSAKLAVFILHGLGYPVLQTGKYIYMPNIAMEVARECSGIRFLTTVVALGIPLVYLSQRNWKRAGSVLVLGCLIAILTNGVRVAIAGILGTKYGAHMLHGPFHIFQGWFVAQVGLIFIFVLNALFERLPNPDKVTLATRGAQVERSGNGGADISRSSIAAFSTVAAVMAIYLAFFAAPRVHQLATPLDHLPVYIGEFRAANEQWLDAKEFYPDADQQLVRVYRDAAGNTVRLFIARYDVQSGNKAAVTYRERALHQDESVTDIAGLGRVAKSTTSIRDKDNAVLSWFYVAGSEPMPNRVSAKLAGFASALFRRRNDTAVVLIAAPFDSSSDKQHAEANALRFATQASAEITRIAR